MIFPHGMEVWDFFGLIGVYPCLVRADSGQRGDYLNRDSWSNTGPSRRWVMYGPPELGVDIQNAGGAAIRVGTVAGRETPTIPDNPVGIGTNPAPFADRMRFLTGGYELFEFTVTPQFTRMLIGYDGTLTG